MKALVFTSTVNVVYGGQRIEDGDESLPYFDASQVNQAADTVSVSFCCWDSFNLTFAFRGRGITMETARWLLRKRY